MKWQFDTLSFESDVFGAPVGRVVPCHGGGDDLNALVRAWQTQGQWLVSARIASSDKRAALNLFANGFEPIETLLTLERDISPSAQMPQNARLVGEGDRNACLAIARSAFSYDRFHADTRVPNEAADRLKETWVANSLAGRADAVLVVDIEGQLGGFVTCMSDGDAAVIDLIAVAPDFQGQGLGKILIQGVLGHYAGCKIKLRVGTQDTNLHSLTLYKGQGFDRAKSQVSYHWMREGHSS
ncbi:MAG: GNAT family N-acetyltransferase [Magnetovibrio sp.]|nr:GNAT family N-acetyltransferase [Magnetovibrio sp.]